MDRQHDFRLELKRLLRLAGCSQKQLAYAIGFEHTTLSHKLSGTGGCVLTRSDVKKIIKGLVTLDAIWFKQEVNDLLAIANCPGFTQLEWSTEPLLSLEVSLVDVKI